MNNPNSFPRFRNYNENYGHRGSQLNNFYNNYGSSPWASYSYPYSGYRSQYVSNGGYARPPSFPGYGQPRFSVMNPNPCYFRANFRTRFPKHQNYAFSQVSPGIRTTQRQIRPTNEQRASSSPFRPSQKGVNKTNANHSSKPTSGPYNFKELDGGTRIFSTSPGEKKKVAELSYSRNYDSAPDTLFRKLNSTNSSKPCDGDVDARKSFSNSKQQPNNASQTFSSSDAKRKCANFQSTISSSNPGSSDEIAIIYSNLKPSETKTSSTSNKQLDSCIRDLEVAASDTNDPRFKKVLNLRIKALANCFQKCFGDEEKTEFVSRIYQKCKSNNPQQSLAFLWVFVVAMQLSNLRTQDLIARSFTIEYKRTFAKVVTLHWEKLKLQDRIEELVVLRKQFGKLLIGIEFSKVDSKLREIKSGLDWGAAMGQANKHKSMENFYPLISQSNSAGTVGLGTASDKPNPPEVKKSLSKTVKTLHLSHKSQSASETSKCVTTDVLKSSLSLTQTIPTVSLVDKPTSHVAKEKSDNTTTVQKSKMNNKMPEEDCVKFYKRVSDKLLNKYKLEKTPKLKLEQIERDELNDNNLTCESPSPLKQIEHDDLFDLTWENEDTSGSKTPIYCSSDEQYYNSEETPAKRSRIAPASTSNKDVPDSPSSPLINLNTVSFHDLPGLAESNPEVSKLSTIKTKRKRQSKDPNESRVIVVNDKMSLQKFVDNILADTVKYWGLVQQNDGQFVMQFVHSKKSNKTPDQRKNSNTSPDRSKNTDSAPDKKLKSLKKERRNKKIKLKKQKNIVLKKQMFFKME